MPLPDAPAPHRVFLTGGSGYVGRNLIRHFVARSIPVVALARSARAAGIVSRLGAIAFEGDLVDGRLVQGMAGCDTLIHAAADVGHGIGTDAQYRTNRDGTRHAFQAAREAGIARAVHIGTESVLLDGTPLVNANEAHPMPRKPAGAYSLSKGDAERIALSSAAPGFDVVVVRPRMVWGRDDTTALPQLLAAATSGKLAWIDGGEYLTSTTHIANLCEGVACTLARGTSGEVYFISDGESVPFRAFVSKLLETQGIVPPTQRVPRWVVRSMAGIGELLARVSGGRIEPPVTLQQYATMAVEVTFDITKARDGLGYRPVIDRDTGLAEMAASSAR